MERCTTAIREPWNKGKLVGQKAPLKLKEIWAIRARLQLANRRRELALFNLAIDSKLRACDLVKLRVRDVCHGGGMASWAIVLQQKTQCPVQFEITEATREAVSAWISHAGLTDHNRSSIDADWPPDSRRSAPPMRAGCQLPGHPRRCRTGSGGTRHGRRR